MEYAVARAVAKYTVTGHSVASYFSERFGILFATAN